jgi:hypothetical protein
MMSIKDGHTECKLRNDPRCIAGVGAVVSYAAMQAGLGEWEKTGFTGAAEEACRETLSALEKLGKQDLLMQVGINHFPGRVEVTIEPSVNNNGTYALEGRAAVNAVQSVCQELERKGVDQAVCEPLPHSFRMKLIKYGADRNSPASD